MSWTSIRRAARFAAACISLGLIASCGGGEPGANASAAPPSAAAFKGKDPVQTPSSAALAAEPLSLIAAPGTARVIGSLGDGGYAVVWCQVCDAPADLTTREVVVQRFGRDGSPVQPQVRLSLPETDGTMYYAGAGVLHDGSTMLAYGVHVVDIAANQQRYSLLTQRYDRSGLPVGEPVEVASHVQSYWSNPGSVRFGRASFLSWSDGTYLVKWVSGIVSSRSQTGPVHETYARPYDGGGNPVAAPRSLARIYEAWGSEVLGLTALDDGGYVAEVRKSGPPEPTTVSFVPYDSADRSVPILAASVDYSQSPPRSLVVPLALGGYVRLASDGSSTGQILDNQGSILATVPVPAGTPYPLADGSFAVVSQDTTAAAGSAVLVQRYDLLGMALGEPTRAGPAAPLRFPYFAGASLAEVGLALTFEASDANDGAVLYTQLLHEADPSRRQLVSRCRAAARDLVGSGHRQFMSRCLHPGGTP